MNVEQKEKLTNIAYYLIIAVVSILTLAFMPMMGSELGLQLEMPDTVAGWIVWSISKLCVSVVNILIFHCFMQQAKVNVKDNEKFIKGKEILQSSKSKKEVLPLSPKKWTSLQYGSKGTTMFLFTMLTLIGLGDSILRFDLIAFMSAVFTIVMAIVFGYIQMRKAEDYWTGEFYEYALMKQHEEEKENEDGREKISQSTGTSPEEQE